MRQEKYSVRKRKLATVTAIRLVIFFLIILIAVDIVVGVLLQKEILNIYQEFSVSYAEMLSERIDANKAKRYLETGQKDEYYESVLSEMQGMVKTGGLRYLYVFVPEKEGIRYIWDSQADKDSRPLLDFWEYDGTYPKDEVIDAYERSESEFYTYTYKDMDLAAALTPLLNSEGKAVAMVESDILMPHIRSGSIRIVIVILLHMCLIMLITMIVFYSFVRRRIIGPLLKLNLAAVDMVDNLATDKELVIDVNTGDEIETVARSFENMNRKLHDYIEENTHIQLEKQRVNTELNLAAKLQADMLPSKFPAFPDRNELLIYADMTPAKEVGGDFYDFFFIDHDHLAIIMADVSGKGIPAAMFMMMSKSLIESRVSYGGDPGRILEEVNDMICANNPETMFVTVWLGILNTRTGVVEAANAGHEKPVIYHEGGKFEIVEDKHGAMLGLKKGLKFPNYEIKLEPRSKLMVYTDGVPEAMNDKEEQFGMERMLKAINSKPDGRPEDILMLVDRDVYLFLNDAEQFDDLTMLCVEYMGSDDAETV